MIPIYDHYCRCDLSIRKDGITLFHIMYELGLGMVVFLKGASASQRTCVAVEGIRMKRHGLRSVIFVMVALAFVSE